MSKIEREDGEVYPKDGKWYVYAPAFGSKGFGPFDTQDEAYEKRFEYGEWQAAMDAN